MTGGPWAPLAILSLGLLAACESAHESTPGATTEVPGAHATRVVTLSPHLAELVHAVGAGDRLVAVSAFTDYPPQTADLPVVGDAFNLDLERLLLLEPDLLLAWESGTPNHVIDELRGHGFRVEVIQSRSLDDIASAIENVGRLTGHPADGAAAAAGFREALANAAGTRPAGAPLSVFYQVDARPLYTISSAHFISEVVELCGGRNVFADIGDLAPRVSVEAVLDRDPDVLLASSDAGPEAFRQWDRWPDLAANRYGNRFILPADEVGRPTPRLAAGVRAVCEALHTARENRDRHAAL